MKKLITVFLLILIITGCTTVNGNDTDVENPDDIENIDEYDLYAQNIGREFTNWKKFAECEKGSITVLAGKEENNQEFSTYLLDDLHVGYTPTFILIDSEGKILYFNDGELSTEDFVKLVNSLDSDMIICFEVVATTCSHCRNQMKHMPDIVMTYPDVVFVEYFITDTMDDVKEFYDNNDV